MKNVYNDGYEGLALMEEVCAGVTAGPGSGQASGTHAEAHTHPGGLRGAACTALSNTNDYNMAEGAATSSSLSSSVREPESCGSFVPRKQTAASLTDNIDFITAGNKTLQTWLTPRRGRVSGVRGLCFRFETPSGVRL